MMMHPSRQPVAFVAAFLTAALAAACGGNQAAAEPARPRRRRRPGSSRPPRTRPFRTWNQYLGGADSSQYSSLKQIDKSNVAQLEVAWTYPTGEDYLFNPIVVDGMMYVLAERTSLVALDAATGQGALGARERGRRRRPRHELLAERGRHATAGCCTSNAGFLTAIDARTGRDRSSLRRQRPRRPARRPRPATSRTSARCRPATRAASSRT